MIYNIKCDSCGKDYQLDLDPEKVRRWVHGELIQNVFPDLSPEDRELMLSNTCPACWDKLFNMLG